MSGGQTKSFMSGWNQLKKKKEWQKENPLNDKEWRMCNKINKTLYKKRGRKRKIKRIDENDSEETDNYFEKV